MATLAAGKVSTLPLSSSVGDRFSPLFCYLSLSSGEGEGAPQLRVILLLGRPPHINSPHGEEVFFN